MTYRLNPHTVLHLLDADRKDRRTLRKHSAAALAHTPRIGLWGI